MAGGVALLAGFAFGRAASVPAGADGSPRPPQRLSILLDPARGLSENSGPALAISPSGDAIAYVDTYEGGLTLFVRSLSETTARVVRGSAGASAPFFSADGRWVAFGAPGGLKKAPLTGGDPDIMCPTGTTNFRGGAWGADDRVVFTTVLGLMEVRANGDDCRLIAATDRANRESFFSRPQILASGDILVTTTSVSDDVDGASLDVVTTGGVRRRLVTGARDGRLLPSGLLLFARGNVLHATRVDASLLVVSPDEVRVPERIALGAFGHLSFDVANDGTLVYWSANDIRGRRNLVWVDRQGRRADTGAPARSYVAEPMLSPDAGLIAVPVGDADHFMWLFSLAQKSLTPVWLDRDAHSAVWSPDGRRIAFQAGTDGTRLGGRIAFKDVDGAAPPILSEVVQSDGRISPASWAPNGRDLAFVVQSPDTGLDIGVLDVTTNAHRILLGSPAQETRPAYSPDGRWLAYQSNESGQPEVYVTDAKDMALKRQVSTDGGVDPVWSRNGRELFYLRAATMMAVPVVAGASLTVSRPAALFSGVESSPTFGSYSVAPDGRFLLRSSPPRHDGPSNHVTLVLNWLDELRRLVPPQ